MSGYSAFTGAPNFLQNPPASGLYRPIINGYTMTGVVSAINDERESRTRDMANWAGTHITQILHRGVDQPMTMVPFVGDLEFTVRSEEDRYRWLEAEDGPIVAAFLGKWIQDTWLITAATSSQTAWRTSRRTAYGTGSITTTTHPPDAYIDDTQQTVVTSAPSSGEVKLPATQTADQTYEDVTTPSGLSGVRLKVRYPPLQYIRVTAVSEAVRRQNELVFTVSLEERLYGRYTLL